jgi:DNA-binding Xre family transcriptional regulator
MKPSRARHRAPLPDLPISKSLREAIADHAGSAYGLCQSAGVDQSSLARFRSRERSLSLDSVDRLCGVLGLKLVRRAGRIRAVVAPAFADEVIIDTALADVVEDGGPVPV